MANEAQGHELPKVNINTASSSELMYLPGVGPKTADAIIEYRTRRPFKKSSDIIRIRGIGRKTFKKLRQYIVVNGETTARSKIKITKKNIGGI
jgi:competence protein ComEA